MTSIKDGNLSVKIAGTERVTAVHGLEWDTTNLGDGGGSFWVEPSDPFYPQGDFSELVHGATVDVTHTIYTPGTNAPQTSTWADHGSGARDATLTGLGYVAGSGWQGSGTPTDPYAVALDGSDDYAYTSTYSQSSGEWSVEAWVKWSGTHDPTYDVMIVSHGTTSTSGFYMRHYRAGYCSMGLHRSGAVQYIQLTGGELSSTTWEHLLFVCSNSSLTGTWYRNGVQQTPVALSAAMVPPASQTFSIGTYGVSSTYAWQGAVASVRYYAEALSEPEATRNYAAGPNAYSGGSGLSVTEGAIAEYVAAAAVGTTTQLYKGWILNDPRTAYAGEHKRLTIETGGVAEVARWRQDLGFIYTDSDPDNWFENKYNPKWANIQLGDRIEISVDDETKVTYGSSGPKAAVVGYLPYPGFAYMLSKNNGVRRIKGKVSYNLIDKEHKLRVRLAWRSEYHATREPEDYTAIKTWGSSGTNDDATDETLDETFASPGGAGYLVLMMYTTDTKGHRVDGDRFFKMNVELYTSAIEKRIDEAMEDVADYIGLHDLATTATIGSVEESLVARPPTDPISALNTFASQADKLVEWGWFSYYDAGVSKFEFRARPMRRDPTVIRALDNCYAIDAEQPGATWDVRQRQEDGEMRRVVRLLYGRKGASTWWPAGYPATAVAPKAPNFTSGQVFRGALAPVLMADFSGTNLSEERARKMARQLAEYSGTGLSLGTVTLQGIDVHQVNSGTTWVPAAYLKGGDFVECEQASCGPLPIMRSHVDVDSETVTLDVGISSEQIIEQLQSAGGVFKHRYTRTRSRK